MGFHGFRDVNEWLSAFARDAGHPWRVSVHTFDRTGTPDWSFSDAAVHTETIPYGDRKADIREVRPKSVRLITVDLDGSATAVRSWHLFGGDYSVYFAEGARDSYKAALAAWGFTEVGHPMPAA